MGSCTFCFASVNRCKLAHASKHFHLFALACACSRKLALACADSQKFTHASVKFPLFTLAAASVNSFILGLKGIVH